MARDREHGGAGIGLAITAALVQAHGGRISATSDGAGSGATFTIVLPLGLPQGARTSSHHASQLTTSRESPA
jgi:signal transduction histidine kinase